MVSTRNEVPNAVQDNSPPRSFLDLYLAYTKNQESPEMFHLWCGLTLLSVTLGRKCFMDRGYYRLYPNLFTLLVAGSARCRKSTSVHIALDLLHDLIEQGRIKLVSGKITPERFIDELSPIADPDAPDGEVKFRTPDILVVSPELSVMLTKQSYGEPLIHILTDLFDCPKKWSYKTRNRGEVTLNDVFISILGATTPTGIAHGIPATALQEGFASRVVFCFQEDTDRRNLFPVLNQEELNLWALLKQDLQVIAQLKGEFTLTPVARDWCMTWYNDHMNTDPADVRMDGMHGRKHDQLFRVAMLLAAAWRTTQIDLEHVEAALLAINAMEEKAGSAFAELGGDETTPHLARMKMFVRRMGEVSHSILLMRMYPVNSAVFHILVETAIQSGWMKRVKDQPQLYQWSGEERAARPRAQD